MLAKDIFWQSTRVKVGFYFILCLGLTGNYNSPVPEGVGMSIIKLTFKSTIIFFDTADVYGPYTNQVMLAKIHRGNCKQ
ncbi:hypothetical protein ACFX2J_033347 [Malus domestica]